MALASSSTNSSITYTGNPLRFHYDKHSSTLEFLAPDASPSNVWGASLNYAFGAQQAAVAIYLLPKNGSYTLTASCVPPQGSTVTCATENGGAIVTITRPLTSNVTFEIQVSQTDVSTSTALSATVVAAVASSVTAPTSTAARLAGVRVDTNARQPLGPGAKIIHRLVLTTTNPSPDPDARPESMTS